MIYETKLFTVIIIIVRRAPHFQPLMFTGALDRCLISQTRKILRRWLFLTSSFPSWFCRDVGSNPRPPFRGSWWHAVSLTTEPRRPTRGECC